MIAGLLLALVAGALVALSMVVQRYALAYETYQVPVFCCTLRRPIVWFLGLIIYGIANGLYAASMNFAPLSLVSSLFVLLLVFNIIFAKLIVGEEPTANKILGAALIISGATATVLGQPGTFGGAGGTGSATLSSGEPQSGPTKPSCRGVGQSSGAH